MVLEGHALAEGAAAVRLGDTSATGARAEWRLMGSGGAHLTPLILHEPACVNVGVELKRSLTSHVCSIELPVETARNDRTP